MSAKDPFQILADELTLIRKDMDQLQRTSLDKKDAQALHKKLAEGVDRMYRAAPEVQQAIDNRLMAVAAYLKEETTKAAEKAAKDAILNAHDESIDAARSLTQAAGEARRAGALQDAIHLNATSEQRTDYLQKSHQNQKNHFSCIFCILDTFSIG